MERQMRTALHYEDNAGIIPHSFEAVGLVIDQSGKDNRFVDFVMEFGHHRQGDFIDGDLGLHQGSEFEELKPQKEFIRFGIIVQKTMFF